MKTKLALSILLITLLFCFEKGMAQAPAWEWAKSAGGASVEGGFSIATDAIGNVLVTGRFYSDSITFGTTTLNNAGGGSSDIFIVKYDASGNVLWAKSAGGASVEGGFSITTDAIGNVLVTGRFYSDSITFGTTTLNNVGGGSSDIFIVKYNASDNVLWAKSAGGNDYEYSADICTDASQNVLVTGFFASDSINFGTTTLTNTGGNDIFVVKYDSSGNVVWANSAGGTSYDVGSGISVDGNGNVLITGIFLSDSIRFGTTFLANVGIGYSDIFIVKYDATGNVLWAKSGRGTAADYSNGISTDSSGNVLVTGDFYSPSISFGTIILTNTSVGNASDIYIVKYNAAGNVLWAKSVGATYDDYANAIFADGNGNVLVTGQFYGDSITFGTTTLTNVGSEDIFIVKYDSSGNVLWAKSAGGTDSDYGWGICTDGSGNVLVTGQFKSDSINFGATTLINAGIHDIFVAKFDNTTGISEQNPTNNLTLYPNPTTDYITIHTNSNKKQVITISDITGKIIYTTTTLSDKTIINTKDFPHGAYAVQVQAGDAVQTRKIVVTR